MPILLFSWNDGKAKGNITKLFGYVCLGSPQATFMDKEGVGCELHEPREKKEIPRNPKAVVRDIVKQWQLSEEISGPCLYCNMKLNKEQAVEATTIPGWIYHPACWEKHYKLKTVELEEV